MLGQTKSEVTRHSGHALELTPTSRFYHFTIHIS